MLRPAVVILLCALAAPPAAQGVFGGRAAAPGEAPWAATLVAPGRPLPDGVRCSGALIAPGRVLTAAHCVQGIRPASLRVLLGDAPVSMLGRPLRAKATWSPPSYRPVPSPRFPRVPSASAALDDVAVVVLERPAPAGTPVLTLAEGRPPAGAATATYGRGRTQRKPERGDERPAGPSDELRVADQAVLDAAACTREHDRLHRARHHLCTAGSSQACSGDSGGPVVVDGAAAGVVSWGGETQGRGCGEGLPDVSELVAPHRADLLAASLPAAPWARKAPRVRVRGRTASCSAGTWGGSAARFSFTWVRPARHIATERDRRGRVRRVRVIPERKIARGRRLTLRRHRAVCVVRAQTAGGWATERSSNAAPGTAQ